MHPLVLIALVLLTALLWLAFTVLMISRLERTTPRAQSRQRKIHRMHVGGFRHEAVGRPWLLRRTL